jgi:hypothetical protein
MRFNDRSAEWEGDMVMDHILIGAETSNGGSFAAFEQELRLPLRLICCGKQGALLKRQESRPRQHAADQPQVLKANCRAPLRARHEEGIADRLMDFRPIQHLEGEVVQLRLIVDDEIERVVICVAAREREKVAAPVRHPEAQHVAVDLDDLLHIENPIGDIAELEDVTASTAVYWFDGVGRVAAGTAVN